MRSISFLFGLMVIAYYVICSLTSCSAIPKVQCLHSVQIPITVIGIHGGVHTDYVPICDTVKLIPRAKKVKSIVAVSIPDSNYYAHCAMQVIKFSGYVEKTFKQSVDNCDRWSCRSFRSCGGNATTQQDDGYPGRANILTWVSRQRWPQKLI
jgi:hypothetical protein